MCDGFYLADIKHQCSFQKSFPVSGGAGVYNVRTLRKQTVNFLNGTDGSCKRASVIVVIE